MNWALDHIQLLLAVAAGLAAWIKQRKAVASRNAQRGVRPPQAQTVSRSSQFDSEAAERTRLIQEEIRRKIAERARVAQSAPVPQPPSLPVRPVETDPFTPQELQRRNPSEVPRPPEPLRPVQQGAGAMTANRVPAPPASTKAATRSKRTPALPDVRERAPEMKKRSLSLPSLDEISIELPPIALFPSAGALLPPHPLRAALSNPEEIRRAIVLSEVLQPPVALR